MLNEIFERLPGGDVGLLLLQVDAVARLGLLPLISATEKGGHVKCTSGSGGLFDEVQEVVEVLT